MMRVPRLFRVLLALAIAWCGVAEAAQLFSLMFFGVWVAGDWFLILLASDGREMFEFIRLNPMPLAVGCSVVMASLACAVASLFLRRKAWLVLAGVFVLYVVQGVVRLGAVWSPVYLAYDTVRGIRDYGALVADGKWNAEDEAAARRAAADPATRGLPSVVLVVGESLTVTRMRLYGYARETTPRLSALSNELAVLPPRHVASSYTAKALQRLLVHDGMTLVKRMRRRGYRTVLVSGQRHWERYCGVEQMVFSACERKRYVSDERQEGGYSDLNLVQWVGEELAGEDRPTFLIVHMMGSHYPFSERYPSYWTKGPGMDDYDMSVRMTDLVLADIIGVLPRGAALVFTSDHGETPDAGSWRNADDAALFAVPLLVYPASATNRVSFVGEALQLH